MNRSNKFAKSLRGHITLLSSGGALILLLSACGTSTSASSTSTTNATTKSTGTKAAPSGIAVASAELAKYSAAQALVPPGPAFDASKASGKFVWIVEQLAANPAVATVAKNVELGLTHENVKYLTCDAHGVSLEISSCIQQGLAQHPAAIIADGGDPSSFTSGIQAASADHVPIISALDVPLPNSSNAAQIDPHLAGIAADAAPPSDISGKLAADFVVKDSKGDAHVLFITSPGILGSQYVEQTFASRMKELCSRCTLDVQAVTIPNWAADLGPTVSAQLRLHPNINYVVPVFSPMATYTDPAITQAGKSNTVKVVTTDGSLQQMTDLAQGQLIVCDVGENQPEIGFLAADETLRYISGATGSTIVKSAQPTIRVFTTANIGSISVNAAGFNSGAWYTGSTAAMTNMFYKLWSNS